MDKVWRYSVLLLLFCSSYSRAYEQQYHVGDTGPNGGVVTSVNVVPTLSNTQEEMVGDFLETTYTYTYTETVTEDYQQTTYETVTVTEEVTTQNLLGTGTGTNVSTSCYDANIEVCTGSASTGGGSQTYSVDLSEYENKKAIDYGATVYSHQSNTSVPVCSATSGDCKDQFKLTVQLLNNGSLVQSYTHNYSDINWAGTADYSFTQDVNALTFNSAQIEFYGVDAGYYSGYYGPGFSDMFFNLTYDQISEVINTIITTIEYTSVLSATEYEYSSQYIPPPPELEVDIVDYNTGPDSLQMQFQDVNGGMVSFDIEVVESPGGEVSINIDRIDAVEEVREIESLDVAVSEEAPNAQENAGETRDESSNEESQIAEGEENGPDSGGQEPVRTAENRGTSEAENKEERSSDKQTSDGKRDSGGSYNAVVESVKIALLVQSQSTIAFESTYKQIELPNIPFYDPISLDGGTTYDHPYGHWATEASDYLWNKMVDEQWQK